MDKENKSCTFKRICYLKKVIISNFNLVHQKQKPLTKELHQRVQCDQWGSYLKHLEICYRRRSKSEFQHKPIQLEWRTALQIDRIWASLILYIEEDTAKNLV